MARSTGWSAVMALEFESVYGTAPGGNWNKMPFISQDLGAAQDIQPAPEAGYGRDPAEPVLGPIDVTGRSVVVPIDVRNFGQWLKLLLGDPISDEDSTGQYSHTFQSGSATTLPSASIEIGHPRIPTYFLITGVRANTLSFSMQRGGAAQATIGLEGQGETRSASSGAGTVTEATFKRFNQVNGALYKDSVAIGTVTALSFNFSNNLDRIESVRDDGLIEDIDSGLATYGGSFTVRFGSTEYAALAENSTVFDLQMRYRIDDNNELLLDLHRVRIPRAPHSINGPGGISATYNFQAEKDQSIGRAMTVTLTNDVASY